MRLASLSRSGTNSFVFTGGPWGPGREEGPQEAPGPLTAVRVSEFQVTAGLYQRAFHHFSEAVRAAEEEAGPSARGQGPTAGMTVAYLTLAEFCDQQLRREEEGPSGEPHIVSAHSLSV